MITIHQPRTGRADVAPSGGQVFALNSVRKVYRTPAGDFTALDDISLAACAGEFVAIVGRSGSGKTTLANVITGIDSATSGDVWANQHRLTGLSEAALTAWRGRRVGVVFQFFQLLPTLTVLENVMLRAIAIMKTIGGRTMQIAGLYLTLLLAISVAAVVVGIPLGLMAGAGFSDVIGDLLNLRVSSSDVPSEVVAGLAIVAIVVPLAFALFPIQRATGATVREALADYGVVNYGFGGGTIERVVGLIRGVDRTLLLSLRNSVRRKGRLILNMALLRAAGAIFLAALNVQLAWQSELVRAAVERHYDIELRLLNAQPVTDVEAIGPAMAVLAWPTRDDHPSWST